MKRILFKRLFRVAGGSLFLFLTILFFGVHVSSAQFKFREPINRQTPDGLSGTEGKALWHDFLRSREQGMFVITGQLVHRPPADSSKVFSFNLSADWNSQFEETKLQIQSVSGNVFRREVRIEKKVEGILYREDGSEDWKILPTSVLGEYIFPEIPLAWEDLLMTFFKWENPRYIGPKRFMGRPAHAYRLQNPDPGAPTREVEVLLDEDFAALLEIQFFSLQGKLERRLRVGGFKEFAGGWLFSSLTWENRYDRSSTRFEVFDFTLERL